MVTYEIRYVGTISSTVVTQAGLSDTAGRKLNGKTMQELDAVPLACFPFPEIYGATFPAVNSTSLRDGRSRRPIHFPKYLCNRLVFLSSY